MKKSVLLGIVGVTGLVAGSSFGQGFIQLNNYFTGGNQVTYGANVPANGISGALGTVGDGLTSAWTIGLYFSPTAVSESGGIGIPASPLVLGTGGGSTVAVATGNSSTAGYYYAGPEFNTGLAAGANVWVEVIAYPSGSTYANALYRGHSAAFQMVTVPVTSTTPEFTGSFPGSNIIVAPVPEPATLALAGLGGLSALVALRRKQS